jgi:hypothetical protein
VCGAAIHGSFTVDPASITADGQPYAGPNASTCAARASAWVSMCSRMFATLPLRTVMAKTQSSLNGLFVALIFPVAEPMTSLSPRLLGVQRVFRARPRANSTVTEALRPCGDKHIDGYSIASDCALPRLRYLEPFVAFPSRPCSIIGESAHSE